MRIVLLGDSHLARIRRDLSHVGANVVNAAVGGSTVHDLEGQARAASIGPDDVVVLSVGTNDAAPWKQVPEALYRDVLDRFLGSCHGDRCVVMLPPGVVEARLNRKGDRTNGRVEDYRAASTAAADAVGAQVLDPRPLLSPLGPSAFADDGIHLSGEGYRVLIPALRAVAATTA